MYKEQINVAKSVNGKPVQPTRSQLAYKVAHLLKKFIVSRKPVRAGGVARQSLNRPCLFSVPSSDRNCENQDFQLSFRGIVLRTLCCSPSIRDRAVPYSHASP